MELDFFFSLLYISGREVHRGASTLCQTPCIAWYKLKKKKVFSCEVLYRGALESMNASVSRRQRRFPAAGHLLFMTAGAEKPLR